MKKQLSIIIAILFALSLTILLGGCESAGAGAGDPGVEDTVINISGIPGVTPPAAGETPVTTITETNQYTGTVSWSPADASFGYSTAYTATVTLTPKSGFTLVGVIENFFTVTGANSVTHDAGSGVVAAEFPATGDTPPEVIDLSAIPGVAVPVLDGIPVTEITETAQYTGTVSWSPDDGSFRSITEYTATITLTAKSGFTLSGVSEDFFTVAGASSVTHDADSGVVTAVFPATSAAPITLLAIPGVVAPVVGETPVTTAINTAQYTGTISWSPADNPFAASTVYTATIVLTAKAGWTLNGVAANSFTVTGASATNGANSGTVTAVFPATSAAPITLLAIPGVVAPVVGETPVTTAIDTAQYTGAISWSPADNPFAGSTVYTATIALIAKAGWTLNGVAANSFTVAGATAMNAEDSGLIAAVFPSTEVEYAIGDQGPAGGFIFYIDEAEEHEWTYLEAAPVSTEWIDKEWGDYGTAIGGDAALTGIGDGQAATDAIVSHMGGKSITGTAAQLCDALEYVYEGTTYNDWFLPSKGELNAIWDNIVDNSGIGEFANEVYWSSSEYSSSFAWHQSFSIGTQLYIQKYNSTRWVRAVRSF